jgi:pseudaminic acid biosynthesis-associated methylase
MKKITKQMGKWGGEFGSAYTDRFALEIDELQAWYQKHLGITRTELNLEIIGDLNRSIRILEVGSNIGNQLLCLKLIGFQSLYGIDMQRHAVELSKSRAKEIDTIQGSAFDIPFKDSFFDLVFTSGVLIHIAPQDIKEALKEIYRCTNKYIWGYEYYADSYIEVEYRGNRELLWKTNFAKLYLDTFSDLKLVKEKKVKYLENDNIDAMFLLEKR